MRSAKWKLVIRIFFKLCWICVTLRRETWNLHNISTWKIPWWTTLILLFCYELRSMSNIANLKKVKNVKFSLTQTRTDTHSLSPKLLLSRIESRLEHVIIIIFHVYRWAEITLVLINSEHKIQIDIVFLQFFTQINFHIVSQRTLARHHHRREIAWILLLLGAVHHERPILVVSVDHVRIVDALVCKHT